MQIARMYLLGVPALARSALARISRIAYTSYVAMILLVLGFIGIPLMFCVPGLRTRWRVARALVNSFLFAVGVPIELQGSESDSRLPLTPAAGTILIANHASYMDWLIMMSVVKTPFRFIAKGELSGVPLLAALLERLDVMFVDRSDAQRGHEDTMEIQDALHSGASIMIFPEGTFRRMPGVLPFKLGAFQAAVATNAQMLAFGIRGTRSILRDGSWTPRRGKVRLSIASVSMPDSRDDDWRLAIELRDTARAQMIEQVGEPRLDHRALTGG
jgi:1-acyl-sn-glycerol-3-phosphate acyltransferase